MRRVSERGQEDLSHVTWCQQTPEYADDRLCGCLHAFFVYLLLSKRALSYGNSIPETSTSALPIINRQTIIVCPPTTMGRQQACQLFEFLLHRFSSSQYILSKFLCHYLRTLLHLKWLKPQIASPQDLFADLVPVNWFSELRSSRLFKLFAGFRQKFWRLARHFRPTNAVSLHSPIDAGLHTEGWFLKNSGGASFSRQNSSSLCTLIAMKFSMCWGLNPASAITINRMRFASNSWMRQRPKFSPILLR